MQILIPDVAGEQQARKEGESVRAAMVF